MNWLGGRPVSLCIHEQTKYGLACLLCLTAQSEAGTGNPAYRPHRVSSHTCVCKKCSVRIRNTHSRLPLSSYPLVPPPSSFPARSYLNISERIAAPSPPAPGPADLWTRSASTAAPPSPAERPRQVPEPASAAAPDWRQRTAARPKLQRPCSWTTAAHAAVAAPGGSSAPPPFLAGDLRSVSSRGHEGQRG